MKVNFYGKSVSLVLLVLPIFLFGVSKTYAIDFEPPEFKDKSFQAQYYDQSIDDPIIIEAGATKEVVVRFKNVGEQTWQNSGLNYASVYTINPKYRQSKFANASWLSKDNPAKVSKTTESGQIGEFKIKLTAPAKIGDYKEDFYLAAEDTTWIKGGYFYLQIKVIAATGKTTLNQSDGKYRADLLFLTTNKIKATGGQKIDFTARYINTGKDSWPNYIWQENGSYANNLMKLSVANTKDINIADSSWLSEKKIVSGQNTVEPDKPLHLTFSFRAPTSTGSYVAKFNLTVAGQGVSGAALEVPITVTEDAPIDYQPPVLLAETSKRQLIDEPAIRVGLWQIGKPAQFKSSFPYRIFNDQAEQGLLEANDTATLDYKSGIYYFTSSKKQIKSNGFIRLVPFDNESYFMVENYKRDISWKGDKKFNVYRGILEFKYSPRKDAVYIVNELPLDQYVAGIAETTNEANPAYIKAVLVAARSYGYYHINNGVPKNQRTFDVYASTVDQLYLGYEAEMVGANIVKATKSTYGEMATYNSEVVVTPYFGHSDGSTRTWKEVWGGDDKPWLQRVACKYDEGLSMYGHGVGMSMLDASKRAINDSWDYKQILKYYYKGVEIERIY